MTSGSAYLKGVSSKPEGGHLAVGYFHHLLHDPAERQQRDSECLVPRPPPSTRIEGLGTRLHRA